MTRHPEFMTLPGLFSQGQYRIPIYQRNYAWGPAEVQQLLQDIADRVPVGNQPASHYYLGSLVVHQLADDAFETIDGQQRHTTLSIVLAALKRQPPQDADLEKQLTGLPLNLCFESRPDSSHALHILNRPDLPIDQLDEPGMLRAYQTVEKFLSKKTLDRTAFTRYLLNHVQLLRVVVPPDTDLNHYFEIMNNRGEQLEKHEVLKARLMDMLPSANQHSFARVWEACADMDRYLVRSFSAAERKAIFGPTLEALPGSFACLNQALRPTTDTESGPSNSLKDLLEAPVPDSTRSQPQRDDGAYRSIVTFPNFLLLALRIYTGGEAGGLDDKKLLDSFKAVFGTGRPAGDDRCQHAARAVEDFALTLLKCRQLLDRYIIKREIEGDWTLKTVRYSDKSQLGEYNSFDAADSHSSHAINRQLVMLLSMFHASYPNPSRKYWLAGALGYLHEQSKDDHPISAEGYRDYLETLCDRFFHGRFYAPQPEGYDTLLAAHYQPPFRTPDTRFAENSADAGANIEHNDTRQRPDPHPLHQGTHISHFIFNRLDYLLWKQWVLNNNAVGCKDADLDALRKKAERFRFRQNQSVEHHYPRNPLSGQPMTASDSLPQGVDSFGNLCLMSLGQNARLNNRLPDEKRSYYNTRGRVDSLKHLAMMGYRAWGPGTECRIRQHENAMLELLCCHATEI